jgi:hypothetical protein
MDYYLLLMTVSAFAATSGIEECRLTGIKECRLKLRAQADCLTYFILLIITYFNGSLCFRRCIGHRRMPFDGHTKMPFETEGTG